MKPLNRMSTYLHIQQFESTSALNVSFMQRASTSLISFLSSGFGLNQHIYCPHYIPALCLVSKALNMWIRQFTAVCYMRSSPCCCVGFFFTSFKKRKKKKKSKNIFNLCWRWSDHGLVSFGRILLHFGFFAVISGAYIHTNIQNALLHHCCTLGKPDTKQKKHEHISVCSVFVTMQQVAINLSATEQ